MYPSNYLYSQEHEWVHVEEDICVIGVTDFAQQELGEVVFVDLPEVGEAVVGGDEIGSIESVKAVAEVFVPVSGEVTEVNGELEETPELVNQDPHQNGWLVKIRLSAANELEGLMSAEKYQAFLDGLS